MRQILILGLRAAVMMFLAMVGSALPISAERGFAADSSSAVIIMYHRFGESDYLSTNIQISQFRAHIEELKKSRYTVLPVPEIVARIGRGEKLPDRTIGITIDDAYESVYRHAWPMLKEAKLPFTLFVATEPVDRIMPGYMSWKQIRELKDAGVTIGSQTKSHPHLPRVDSETVKKELDDSNARFRKEIGKTPDLFAYPYGEYSLSVRQIVVDRGFKAAFGQNSGVMHGLLDPYTLPRFALNERFGGIDRFRLIANALPLPVTDILPEDPVLGQNPPAFGFTVAPDVGRLNRLACFSSSEGEVQSEQLDRRVEIRFKQPFPPGRSRVNCTMPGAEGRWHWFGVQFVVKP